VHPPVAALLIGVGGAAVRQLEEETGRSIFVRGADDCMPEEIRILAQGERKLIEGESYPVREGEQLDVVIEKPHLSSQGDGIAKVHGYVIDVDGGADHVGQRVTVEVTRAFRTFAKARIL
jgi:ribonuclease G